MTVYGVGMKRMFMCLYISTEFDGELFHVWFVVTNDNGSGTEGSGDAVRCREHISQMNVSSK